MNKPNPQLLGAHLARVAVWMSENAESGLLRASVCQIGALEDRTNELHCNEYDSVLGTVPGGDFEYSGSCGAGVGDVAGVAQCAEG